MNRVISRARCQLGPIGAEGDASALRVIGGLQGGEVPAGGWRDQSDSEKLLSHRQEGALGIEGHVKTPWFLRRYEQTRLPGGHIPEMHPFLTTTGCQQAAIPAKGHIRPSE